MKFKKIGIIIILSFFMISTLDFPATAKLKDSPTTGYSMTVTKNIPYYDKVNGKKKGVIKYSLFYYYKENNKIIPQREALNSVKIVKFVNNEWVKVTFQNKNNLTKSKVGFIKFSKKNLTSVNGDYMNLVIFTKKLNLREKPSTKSKIITQIPLGTKVKPKYFVKGPNSGGCMVGEFFRVTYVKNGKKYVGYLHQDYVA